MTDSSAYAIAVADYGRRFIAAKTEPEREDARADFDSECLLLSVFGPRSGEPARDTAAERILAARFGH